MAYVKQNWENSPSTVSPLSADRLNHLETQYDEAVSYADSLQPVDPEWQDYLGFAEGYGNQPDNPGYRVRYRVVGDKVQFSGLMTMNPEDTSTSLRIVGTLPEDITPTRTVQCVGIPQGGVSGLIRVEATDLGDLRMYFTALAASATWVALDQMEYFLDLSVPE